MARNLDGRVQYKEEIDGYDVERRSTGRETQGKDKRNVTRFQGRRKKRRRARVSSGIPFPQRNDGLNVLEKQERQKVEGTILTVINLSLAALGKC